MTTLAELAKIADAELRGDGQQQITGVATLRDAGPSEIAFLANAQYRHQLADTVAGAVILAANDADDCPCSTLVCANPYASYAKVAAVFAPASEYNGVHPTAVVDESAVLASNVTVGPGAVIGAGVSIGANSVIYPNVTIYSGVQIGANCLIHAGAVIGADGFGFAPEQGRYIKVPQLGTVAIGSDVEIGANTTIDCGALADTVIGDGVKIDNNVQIGHNVRIGDHTVIAAMVGIAGSATIGRGCMIGGQAGIAGHIDIADGVMLTGRTMVTKGLPESGVYSSGIPVDSNANWRRNVARFRKLDDLFRRVNRLERSAQDKQGVEQDGKNDKEGD